MFCTSLRRRKSFAKILDSLTLRSSLGVRENDLKTHDIALPLSSQVDPDVSTLRSSRQLRLLLLSPSTMTDIKLPTTLERIRHFASLTGGKDVAMVFLLYPSDDTGPEASTAGMMAYTKLQAEMMDHTEIPSIPILPLPKLEGLANVLKSHQAALAAPRPSKHQVSTAASFDLLRQCSNNPPLNQQAAFMLTDFFADLRDLATACTTESSAPNTSSPAAMNGNASRAHLRGHGDTNMYDIDHTNDTHRIEDASAHGKLRDFRRLQGDAQYRDLVDFWNVEYAV